MDCRQGKIVTLIYDSQFTEGRASQKLVWRIVDNHAFLAGYFINSNALVTKLVLNWNGTVLSYDQNGNMLSDGTNSFTWNARNQVAALNSVALQYDAGGRRIKNAAIVNLC